MYPNELAVNRPPVFRRTASMGRERVLCYRRVGNKGSSKEERDLKINEIICQKRQDLGLTQEGRAKRLGVSAPAVNKWERGPNCPDITPAYPGAAPAGAVSPQPYCALGRSPHAHLSAGKAAEEGQETLLRPVLERVERDPACAFLRAELGWEERREAI